MGQEKQGQYNQGFITALQWMWGDGYLAPGGPEEIAELLHSVEVRGREVLDLGCGLGAISGLLVDTHGARRVTGVDVEPHLIEHCRQRIDKLGLSDKIDFRLVEPGPLPFDDHAFDLIFTKDAVVHIADKDALYRDVLRVLRPGGVFVGSDWLRGDGEDYSERVAEWLEFVHLDFRMQNLQQTRAALQQAGFVDVSMNDRNAWYCEEVKKELAALSGERFLKLAEMCGQEAADYRLQSSTLKQKVIEEGFLRPTHFVGHKPEST